MKSVIDLLWSAWCMVRVAWLDWHLERCDDACPDKGKLIRKRNKFARGQRKLEYRLPA